MRLRRAGRVELNNRLGAPGALLLGGVVDGSALARRVPAATSVLSKDRVGIKNSPQMTGFLDNRPGDLPRTSVHLDAAAPVSRPLLMVDIDGVVSLFGAHPAHQHLAARAGSLHSIDGTPHFLSSTAATHLLALADLYELVWASGWEERANEHLPRLLGLPRAPIRGRRR